ncbi:TniB family NTP-binding protein [Oceanospirillum linum]|uniref:AAA+ ATPase domain-containing protein n=1 Tax=Oceanospirillum linum TaxID=966 RepID=A0A1T1HG04_OCELI|nr:TniB family NTP-binding protein [Oceanospirillum linum]OOV88789.1 hypothetical protein BTA35_0204750 [Oceanospirillum linum]SEF99905.1 AAA domain-containing protein [Oleiphilus messinensis]SMP22394.1 TniB protein [Oceanospirillum linum]
MPKLTDAQKANIRQFKDSFCLYYSIKKLLSDLETVFESSEIGGEPLSMLITGDTGSGKSSTINHFIKSKISPQTGRAPILSTRVPSRATAEETTKQMLIDLGVFGSSVSSRKSSDQNLTNRLISAVKDSGIKLIIINEFQELVEFKKPKDQQVISNRLKVISESTEVPLIFVGMPWSDEIRQDPQWSSRLATRSHNIEYFSIIKKPRQFRDFMKALKSHIPIQRSDDMDNMEEDLRIFAATCGEQRQIKALMTEVYRLCLIQEQPISLKIYDEAFRNLYPTANDQPFKGKLEQVNFREIEMSSRYIRGDSMYPAHIEPAKLSEFYSLSELLSKS